MKILKFNESVDDDIYSLIDKLSGINTLIEDDLIDFKDKGHSLHEDEDGDELVHLLLRVRRRPCGDGGVLHLSLASEEPS